MCETALGPSPKSVRLRDVEPLDLPALFEHQLDPDAIRMAVVNPRDAEAFEAHWANVLCDRSIIAKAILADEILVGHVSCFNMDGQDAVGYWIAKQHWGRGIASRALALLLEQVTIRPLHARVARHNHASIRVLERCGFMITGYQTSRADDRFPECEEALLTLL
jgi:RimJ/RimL family protein N-acetyltransferase